jgi:two-component system, OmpR family, sensor histidine kinase MprB
MTLTRRMAAGAAAAVAFAVVLASVIVYLQTRHVLRAQVDDGLRGLVPRVKVIHSSFAAQAPVPASAGAAGKGTVFRLPDAKFGGASGTVQAIAPDGKVVGKSILSDSALRAAKRGTLEDISRDGTHLRAFVTNGPLGDKLVVARPLTEVDSSLKRLRIILLLVGLGGIGLAGGLGLAVARGAIAPVRRLTAEAEHVAVTNDLSRRMPSDGDGDEIDRLGAAFNTMLAALERSREAQRQLVADASHELRTPLTSIRTNIEILGRAKQLPEAERAEVVAAASAQLEELTLLVGDLVDMARDGRPAPDEVEDVRLDELVNESASRINGGRIAVDSEPSLVRGSRTRLARAVSNLIDNAIKYSPDGSIVEVTVRDGEVAVRDHGPGIAPEDLPHVFDRFYRAPSARSTPGSGLGLAIVRQVAEAHQGSAVAEPAEGGGARLRLRLPALLSDS